jgi:hypothetical protein
MAGACGRLGESGFAPENFPGSLDPPPASAGCFAGGDFRSERFSECTGFAGSAVSGSGCGESGTVSGVCTTVAWWLAGTIVSTGAAAVSLDPAAGFPSPPVDGPRTPKLSRKRAISAGDFLRSGSRLMGFLAGRF